jgi:MFS family permease
MLIEFINRIHQSNASTFQRSRVVSRRGARRETRAMAPGRRGNAHAYRFALLGGLSLGYDVALVGGILPTLEKTLALSAAARGVVVASAKLGGALGAFVGAALMRSHGRGRSASAMTLACSACGSAATWASAEAGDATGMALGRVALGVGVGGVAVIAPAYCGETSEVGARGSVGACFELSVCAGMALANALTWFSPQKTLGLVLFSPAVLGFWSAIVFAMSVESPRWLFRRGDENGARDALRATGADAATVEEEIGEILAEERALGIGFDGGAGDDAGFWRSFVESTVGGVREAMSGDERRAVRLALAMAVLNQMCASTSVINYGSSVFRRLANDASASNGDMDVYNMYTGVIILCKTVGVAASIAMVDSVGRRPLLLFGSAASGFGLCVACFGYAAKSVGWTLFGLCAFILAFSSSFASVFWVLVSELFSMRAKSSAIALVTATLFASGALSDSIFPSMISTIGAGTFVVYAIVCFASTTFVYLYIPETARKPLKEIQSAMKSGLSGYAEIHASSEHEDRGTRVELAVTRDTNGGYNLAESVG